MASGPYPGVTLYDGSGNQIASGTPLQVTGTVTANAGSGTQAVNDAGLNLAQGSTTAGQSGPLAQGAVTTNAPTYTTGQTSPLSLTTGGLLRVDGSSATTPSPVRTGMMTAVTTLNAVTANGAGTANDLGAARANISFVVSTTGTPTGGTVTLLVSLDNATFFTTSVTATVGSGVTSGTLTGGAWRYARCDLSGLTGGTSPTVTAKMLTS